MEKTIEKKLIDVVNNLPFTVLAQAIAETDGVSIQEIMDYLIKDSE